MSKHKIFGIESDGNNTFQGEFKVIRDYEDTSFLAISNKTFQCYLDDDKQVNFKLAVEMMDSAEYDENLKGINTVFALIPTFESLNKKQQESLANFCGFTIEEYREYINAYNNPETITCNDIFDYGMYVVLGYECQEYETPCECVDDYDYTKQTLAAIANVYEAVGSLIGFYLDKPVNRIGETGWDYLKQFCEDC